MSHEPWAKPTGLPRRLLASTLHFDWSQFEPVAALRCTVGVAVPLLVGSALHQSPIAVFGAVGAHGVGFGSFQAGYRSRAATMLYAAAGMGLSIWLGSLAGHSPALTLIAAAVWGFGAGLLVALGPASSFVGLQSAVAVIVAGGFPANGRDALLRGVIVFAGGLLQILLVVIVWPLKRFPTERRALGAIYRSLAAYAAELPGGRAAPPEPRTLAEAAPGFSDPQPFASANGVLAFRAFLDEAERIRASLAALAAQHTRVSDTQPAAARDAATVFATDVSALLREIAESVEQARDPVEPRDVWTTLESHARLLGDSAVGIDALLGQLRAAWRMAGLLVSPESVPAAEPPRVRPLLRLPPIGDSLTTLYANLDLQSAACRHAVRLSATMAIATLLWHLTGLPRGYWIALTALIVLKPEFHDTFSRGLARVAGTLVGAGAATLITVLIVPGHGVLLALILLSVWAGYAFFKTNYTIFSVCITGFIVFLLVLAGVSEPVAAEYRSVTTALGGILALGIYAVWPTWTGSQVRGLLAAMFAAQARYSRLVIAGYANPAGVDLRALQKARSSGRLIRSNAEAAVDRMLAEPQARQPIDARLAMGILAAVRRNALAALALHAGLDRGISTGTAGLSRLATAVADAFGVLAGAVETGTAPIMLPPLRSILSSVDGPAEGTARDELDTIVDAVNTIAMLLTKDAAGAAPDSS